MGAIGKSLRANTSQTLTVLGVYNTMVKANDCKWDLSSKGTPLSSRNMTPVALFSVLGGGCDFTSQVYYSIQML